MQQEGQQETEDLKQVTGTEGANGDNGVDGSKEEQTQDKITLTKQELNDRLARASKSNATKAAEEAVAAYKEQLKNEEDEAKRLKGMSETDKAKDAAEKLKAENEELKQKMARNELSAEARKQIAEKGVEIDDDILDILVTSDAETTGANIEAYAASVTKSAEALFAKSRQGSSFGNGIGKSGAGSENEATMLARRQKELNAAANKNTGLFKRSRN